MTHPPFTPFEARWNAPQLTDAEMADRRAFEWWYFDLEADDGTKLVVIFSRKNRMYVADGASMHVEFYDGAHQVRRVHNFPAASFTWRDTGDGAELTVGDNSFSVAGSDPEAMRYRIRLSLPWIRTDLVATPLHRGFLPSADGSYFFARDNPSRRSCVSFSAPQVTIEGDIHTEQGTRFVSGRGYHDHPWGTEEILRTHQEWYWGRLTSPALNVTFSRVVPAPEYEGRLEFHYLGLPDAFEPRLDDDLGVQVGAWSKGAWNRTRFPLRVEGGGGGTRWDARHRSSLLHLPIINRSVVDWTSADAGAEGSGWIEYYRVPARARTMVRLGSRAMSFFWRPFPYLGR
jgi:hypothetical protein